MALAHFRNGIVSKRASRKRKRARSEVGWRVGEQIYSIDVSFGMCFLLLKDSVRRDVFGYDDDNALGLTRSSH